MVSKVKRWGYKLYRNSLDIPLQKILAQYRHGDISIFFQFRSAPYGGGNQFLQALTNELKRKGLHIENNIISHTTRACLFNSHHFDSKRLQKLRHPGCRMVHRVDGPLTIYRGQNDRSDYTIWQANQLLADATIFQSHYSLQMHVELGLRFKTPHVIINAADPYIFYPDRRRVIFNHRRKIRLISSSWSNNPRKGGPIYKWLDQNLDWRRFEYTFVGRSSETFTNIRHISPLPSEPLAELLRDHDIYITASQHDPCSNALIEALSCGLPAIFLKSGGHPELVGQAGLGFTDKRNIPALLEQLTDGYEQYQAQISLPTLTEVAHQYLAVMGFDTEMVTGV